MGEPALRPVTAADDLMAPWEPPAVAGPTWPATGPVRPVVAPATITATPAATSPAAAAPGEPAADAGEPAGVSAPAAAVGGGEAGLPELELYGRPMTAAERLARHLAVTARASRREPRPGGAVHALWHGKPESLADHARYLDSRAWVPDGHEGALIPGVGLAYGHTIGRAGVAAGLAIAWLFARPLRLVLFLLVTAVTAGLITWFG